MAKYLRPRRGSKANAVAQKIALKKGEMFLEFPNSEIGKGPGRLIIGDGATSYQNMNYATTATNVFRPFITDPEIYIPRFTNTNASTSDYTIDSGTEAINNIGNGSNSSTTTLPFIIGCIKEALCKHADSINRIDKDFLDRVYPIGSIYISTSDTNPGTIFGGTWEQIKDRFLLASGDSYTNASTGGAATVTLNVNQIPSHSHPFSSNFQAPAQTGTGSLGNAKWRTDSLPNTMWWIGSSTRNTGGGQAHENMPPYLTVNMWKRTA